MNWWRRLCSCFNGSANIISREISTSITTDASTKGFGGWSEGDWFLGTWEGPPCDTFDVHDHLVHPPLELQDSSKNINVLELYAVVVGLKRWGPHLRDSQIQIVTDNTQAMYMINTGRSANKTCMSLLREIFWLCYVFNTELYSVYINTRENVFADALSRVSEPTMGELVVATITNLNLSIYSGPSKEDLLKRESDLLTNASAPSTNKARECHARCYERFCNSYSLEFLPCDSQRICTYIAFMSFV